MGQSVLYAARVATYALTRFWMLRLLGLIYLCGFVVFLQQGPALIGEHGLLPAPLYLSELRAAGGNVFFEAPSLFLISCTDNAMLAVGVLGAALSLFVMLGGTNAPVMAVLWVLYSVCRSHRSALLELRLGKPAARDRLPGDLSVSRDERHPFPKRPAPLTVLLLYRWLSFRILLGAGLIKLRGDPCWAELTCLDYHFETQPIPNPLSPFFHFLPSGVHKVGVAFNHFTELVAPFGLFGPRVARHTAGLCALAFQTVLIASGNLSFLNWLTIITVLACFDDGLLRHVTPQRLCAPLALAQKERTPARSHLWATGVLTALVAVLSLQICANLLSKGQRMNATFDPFSLVNTYGAFGCVGRERNELVMEGSNDGATWKEYELNF